MPRLRVPRWVRRVLAVAAALTIVATVVVVAFGLSVPLPADPVIPQASVLYYRDGRTVLARVGANNRTDVPLSLVPPAVRRAVLTAEDRGFYGHSGVSIRGIARAFVADVMGGDSQGASTITQQYVRNAYLTQRRTAGRKAREAVLALKIEHRYRKNQILERYLNTVYFGRGAYGIEAAAMAYFDTTVDRLTPAQGAVLAAVIKDPTNFDPAVDPTGARDRWHYIVATMAKLGWADRMLPAYPAIGGRSDGAAAGPLGLVVDQVERELAGHGISPQLLGTGGLSVVTTIDPAAQRAADEQAATLRRTQPGDLHAAIVAVEPATGAVRAYHGGERGGFFDDAAAPRPPDATFKPVVLAAGLRQGVSYQSLWNGNSRRLFPDRGGVPLVNPADMDYPGCPLDTAMQWALNTPYYALAQRIGGARLRELAVSLGVSDSYDGQRSLVDGPGAPKPGRTRADLSLGVYPVTPADLASVYGTFAAGGIRADRHLVEHVTGSDGHRTYTAATRRTQALPAPVAADVSTVLAQVNQFDEFLYGRPFGRPAATMTGEQRYGDTEDYSDAWTAGYTPQLAAVVWVGRAKPGPIRDTSGAPIDGVGAPDTIWRDFLTAALAGQPPTPLPPPAHVGSVDAGEIRSTHPKARA
jgi:membrane peptidoglycan carboxypeptidase